MAFTSASLPPDACHASSCPPNEDVSKRARGGVPLAVEAASGLLSLVAFAPQHGEACAASSYARLLRKISCGKVGEVVVIPAISSAKVLRSTAERGGGLGLVRVTKLQDDRAIWQD